MSVPGQKQTSSREGSMSALLSATDIQQGDGYVSFVPTRDSCTAATASLFRSPRLREQPTPLGRAGELDELFSQAAKTGAIGKARKAA